jgi:outer membrane lipoprotein-sorting protein
MRLMPGITAALAILAVAATAAAQEPKAEPERWVRESEAALAKVDNYTVTFHKQERVKGKLLEEETTLLKFKKPFKVYMKWVKDPFKGRETLYIEGENDNRIKAHEGGIIGLVTVNLDPAGSMSMKGNRHPITDSGLEKLVGKIGANLRKGLKNNEFTLKDHGDEAVYGRRAEKVEAIYPKEREKGYYCHRAVLWLDFEQKVPIKIEIYDWDDKLVERYGYENLKLNAGLTDADFDPKNPEYHF